MAQLLYLWAAWLYPEQPKCTAKRRAGRPKCTPVFLLLQSHLVPQLWGYSALRSLSCRAASADVWASGKQGYFNEFSTNQSSMAEGLHKFQFYRICASLLCIMLTQSPQKECTGCEGFLCAPAVDILCFSSISLWPGWLPWPVCSFCQGCAHANPAGLSGHLCAESFFPSHSIALQWDKWPFHSIFTEGTPFFLPPDSHPLFPWHPQALGTPLAQAEPAVCPAHSATATAAWPTHPSWAELSSWWSPQQLTPC